MKEMKRGIAALLIAAIMAGTPGILPANVYVQAEAAQTETESQSETQKETAAETEKETEAPAPGDGWNADKTMYYKGGKALTGLQTIGEDKYYFDKNGKITTGLFSYKDSTGNTQTRYFAESGANKGKMLTGWQKISGKKYYFRESTGNLQKGLKKIDGDYYGLDESDGHMLTGLNRLKNKDNKKTWYYFNKKTGKRETEYIKVSKKKYYYAKKKTGEVLYELKKSGSYWRVYNMKGKRLKNLLDTPLDENRYEVRINSGTNVVTIVGRFNGGKYSLPLKAWRCSTGKNLSTSTPRGTFTIHSKYRWLLMVGGTYCQWLTYIARNCLIHSEIYRTRNNKNMKVSAYNKLGHGASHGCVRMQAVAAKWIYDNCRAGTKIKIFRGTSSKDPLGKPSFKKLPSWHTWDPTDPTAKKYCRKKHCHQN